MNITMPPEENLIYSPVILRYMKRFELLDHTADALLRAYGKDLDECFANAAVGMFDIIADLSGVNCVGESRIVVKNEDRAGLLVDFLTDLLYLYEVEGVIICDAHVKMNGDTLEAVVRGEAIDPERHRIKTEVKAVTYHMLEINEEKGFVQVLFDL